MTPRKTYWHLEPLKRRPTDYEIATSRLLYHPQRGFEVSIPLADWYRRHQQRSPLILPDPERFSDPRQTTYSHYTWIQRNQEQAAAEILEAMESAAYDGSLPSPWVAVLSRVWAPLRFPLHGLQMAAAYVGQMAPSGRIAVAALFQTGDEIRRVQRIAYRVRQLQIARPAFGLDGREIWERDPLWQPLRKCIEKLLVTYDWGEAFVALNAVVKPLVDELFMNHFGQLAERSGDPLLRRLLESLDLDCRWHRTWSGELLRLAVADRAENQAVIRGWIRRWHAEALAAVAPFGSVFEGGDLAVGARFASVMSGLHALCRDYWSTAGLSAATTE